MNLICRERTFKDIDKLKKFGLTSYEQFKNELTVDNWGKMYNFLSNLDSYTDVLSNCID